MTKLICPECKKEFDVPEGMIRPCGEFNYICDDCFDEIDMAAENVLYRIDRILEDIGVIGDMFITDDTGGMND